MKPESGINNRWKLLEYAMGDDDLKYKFNAYGWYHDENFRISKNEHWSGCWNECFNFVDIFPTTCRGKTMLMLIAKRFEANGYTIRPIINNGISIVYQTMTQQESHEKAERNLLSGGRMSD